MAAVSMKRTPSRTNRFGGDGRESRRGEPGELTPQRNWGAEKIREDPPEFPRFLQIQHVRGVRDARQKRHVERAQDHERRNLDLAQALPRGWLEANSLDLLGHGHAKVPHLHL